MVLLAAANFVGALLFAAVYAAAGARWLSQGAFLGCLLLLFVLVTFLWVRTEAQHRHLEPLRRFGRIVLGLTIIVIGLPTVVLLPLAKLESVLPPEAQLERVTAPAMALLLVSLVLVTLVNVIGSLVIAGRALLGSRGRA